MCIFKLLPLICLAATAFAIQIPLCRPRHGQVDDSAGSNDICLCATGSPTIINRIDVEHLGVERLVIFVYRKPNTGEIISFIPEREYQRRIPDFPEDYGIIEDTSYNPSILDIFDNSPSKDIRKINTDKAIPVPQPNRPEVFEAKPKDLDIVNGHHQVQPGKDINIPEWQLPVTKPSKIKNREFPKWQRTDTSPSNLEPVDIIPHTEPGTNEYETKDIPAVNNDPFVYNPEDSPIYVTPEHGNGETNPIEYNPDTEIPWINNNPAYPHVPPNFGPQNSEEERYPGDETSGEGEPNRGREDNSSEPSPDIHARPLNSAENPQVPDDSVWDNQGGQVPSNVVPSIKRFRDPLKNKYGRIIRNWPTPSNTYWGNDRNRNTPPFIEYNPISHYDDKGHGDVPSFDYWLKQQLKLTTIDGNKIPTSTSDIIALHNAIRNLLLQNGFVVTRHGTLTDGYGQVTSLTNLKLRPIFIGKSVSYNRFMQGGGIQFKIPTDSPFLEGLLLTMIKPAKIIGIVPLKITSLPDELSPEHKQKKLAIHGQASPFKVLPIEDLLSFRKDSKGHRKRPRPLSNKIAKSKKYKDSALLQQALSDISKPGKIGRGRVKGLGEHEKNIVSEETPDFRIIGGASATSSGTPLLFKGRSGLI